MAEAFILIPGRTSRQGTTLNEGKYTEGAYYSHQNKMKSKIVILSRFACCPSR